MTPASKRSRELSDHPDFASGGKKDDWSTRCTEIEGHATSGRSTNLVLDALVALWADRRSDKHAELYAEAMAALNEWKPQDTC